MKTNLNSNASILSPLPLWRRCLRGLGASSSFLLVCAWLGSSGLAPAQAQPLTWLGGFEGIYSGWLPADPTIAAGPNSLVTMVSGQIGIHNKQGVKLFEQNLGAGGFWAAQGAEGVIEPWVIFDPHSGRFIAVAREAGGVSGNLYLAVSTSSNPTSSSHWHKFGLDLAELHSSTGEPTFPAYPKVAVDSSAIYITANHFGISGGGFSHNKIIAIDKAPVLSGAAVNIVHDESFTDLFGPLHPVMVLDAAAPMCFVTQDPNADTVTIYALADVLTSPSLSSFTVPVPDFEQPLNVPQRGTGALLDVNGSRFMSGVVRNGSLWTAHTVLDPDVDDEALVRWYQFDVSSFPASVALAQSGNVDPGANEHAWLPHINVDADGNMGLGFSVSGPNMYASIGYTGLRAGDNTTLPVEIARAGEGPYTVGIWGQYSGLAIDPDGCTFWLFHEYPTKKKNQPWRTFVGAFEAILPAPPADPLHVGDLDRSSANSGKNWKATVVVTVHDGDENVLQGATVNVAWSTGATASGVTDAAGEATFTLNAISKQTSSVTLTIQNVIYPGLTYAGPNHDPDGDSNGTTITVNKP